MATKKLKQTYWAVVDWDLLHKDNMVFGKVFLPDPRFMGFVEAIFSLKENAEKYSETFNNSGMRTIIVPCEVTYTVPVTKGVRYKQYQKSICE